MIEHLPSVGKALDSISSITSLCIQLCAVVPNATVAIKDIRGIIPVLFCFLHIGMIKYYKESNLKKEGFL